LHLTFFICLSKKYIWEAKKNLINQS